MTVPLLGMLPLFLTLPTESSSHFETQSPEDPLRGVFSGPSQLSINVFDVRVFMGFCPSHHYSTSSILLVLVIKLWDLWQQSLCFIHLCCPRASHGSWHVVSAWLMFVELNWTRLSILCCGDSRLEEQYRLETWFRHGVEHLEFLPPQQTFIQVLLAAPQFAIREPTQHSLSFMLFIWQRPYYPFQGQTHLWLRLC